MSTLEAFERLRQAIKKLIEKTFYKILP